MKGGLIFFPPTFIFLISPNLAKYSCEQSPLEQHYRIAEKEKTLGSVFLGDTIK
jgi:hypothetical protein